MENILDSGHRDPDTLSANSVDGNISVQFNFIPSKSVTVYMDYDSVVEFNFTVPTEYNDGASGDVAWTLHVHSSDDRVFQVLTGHTVVLNMGPGVDRAPDRIEYSHVNTSNKGDETLSVMGTSQPRDGSNVSVSAANVTLRAVLIGRASLRFFVFRNSSEPSGREDQPKFLPVDYGVVVIRKPRWLDTAFTVVVTAFVLFSTMGMGCKADLEVVKEVLKKPIGPVTGFGCQYVLMPLLAYAIAKIVQFDTAMALGFFCGGCCPGGGASNIYSFLLDGDLTLSITMTLISTIAALAMIPFWMFTLGQTLLHGHEVTIPFVNIVQALAYIIIPVVIGMAIKYKSDRAAKIILKVIKPFSVICIIFLFTAGIYANLYMFKLFSNKVIIAGCLLPYAGFIAGGLVTLATRQSWERIKTVAIETGIQNVGVAVVLLRFSLPSPEGDIACIAPIGAAIFTPLPLMLWVIGYLIYKKCIRKPEKGADEKEKEALNKTAPPDEDSKEVVDSQISTV
ncbi:ileal sodium/bile acid cotransporter-like [Lingula anatina]|uniref:Ileal sodium/bile acid cotransporter-like n=1 Tax=Lingula anatina TaxID=7574 RepID=A0A1S3IIC3_LINAN|nr:ileal sodium/bile acid cotransporter-like [Lingula anatina]|eukprot:XP_013397631.1 ileal sodium/bile acid cotransporter-like [Lingula anatina]